MKNTKRFLALCIVLSTLICMLTACSGEMSAADAAQNDNPEVNAYKVALVHTLTGLGDRSINDLAAAALERGKEELGVEYVNVEPKAQSDYETFFYELAATDEYDLIFALSDEQKEPMGKAAEAYPEQRFCAISSETVAPNVSSSIGIWEEFEFAAGYLNGKLTTSDAFENLNEKAMIGIISAVDTPQINKQIVGYICGAKLANPEVEVVNSYIGDYKDVARAKELSLAQFDRGVDIIQLNAGKAGQGAITAAIERNLYATGLGINQNPSAPDNVPFSTENRIGNQIFTQLQKLVSGEWEAGTACIGIAEEMYVVTFEGSNLTVPQGMIDEMKKIEALVADDTFVLPTTMEEIDAWVETNRGALK